MRVMEGKSLHGIDTSRYRLEAPSDKSTDLDLWKTAIHNAQAQLEHQHDRY